MRHTRAHATCDMHAHHSRPRAPCAAQGYVVEATPEFASFRRKFAALWDHVGPVLGWLEQTLRAAAVDMAYADGRKIVDVAQRLQRRHVDGRMAVLPPPPPVLLGCLLDAELGARGPPAAHCSADGRTQPRAFCRASPASATTVGRAIVEPLCLHAAPRRPGRDGQERAAVTVQKAYRMYHARREYRQMVSRRACMLRVTFTRAHWLVARAVVAAASGARGQRDSARLPQLPCARSHAQRGRPGVVAAPPGLAHERAGAISARLVRPRAARRASCAGVG
jgi:hypothetical protein